jgi:hypothetical protein
MKTCAKCQTEFDLESFQKLKSSKDGRYSRCKTCVAEYHKDYQQKNAAKRKAYLANWNLQNKQYVKEARQKKYIENRDSIRSAQREYLAKNNEAINQRRRKARAENGDKVRAVETAWRQKNPEAKRAKDNRHYKANRDKLLEQMRGYYRANSDEIIQRNNEYMKKRMKSDPMYALGRSARGRIQAALRDQGYAKTSKTRQILGCDYPTLKQHIESQFLQGMDWDNRPTWHVDHKIPLASAKTELELLALCHYTNLQPLWAFDNLSKGAKILPQYCSPQA